MKNDVVAFSLRNHKLNHHHCRLWEKEKQRIAKSGNCVSFFFLQFTSFSPLLPNDKWKIYWRSITTKKFASTRIFCFSFFHFIFQPLHPVAIDKSYDCEEKKIDEFLRYINDLANYFERIVSFLLRDRRSHLNLNRNRFPSHAFHLTYQYSESE